MITGFILFQQLVGGERKIRTVGIDLESNSAEELAVISYMRALQVGVSILEGQCGNTRLNSRHISLNLCSRICESSLEGRLLIVICGEYLLRELVVGADGHYYIRRGSALYLDSAVYIRAHAAVGILIDLLSSRGYNLTAVGVHLVYTEEINVPVFKLSGKLDISDAIRNRGCYLSRLFAAIAGRRHIALLIRNGRTESEAQRAVLIGFKSDDESLVGIGCEILTGIAHSVVAVAYAGDSRIKIEITNVVGNARR